MRWDQRQPAGEPWSSLRRGMRPDWAQWRRFEEGPARSTYLVHGGMVVMVLMLLKCALHAAFFPSY